MASVACLRAAEENTSERPFQFLDLTSDRRLSNLKHTGGTGQAARLHHRQEGLEKVPGGPLPVHIFFMNRPTLLDNMLSSPALRDAPVEARPPDAEGWA